jgi:hypothetical protein
MTIERWTDERLDKLADGMERLIGQLHRVSHQMSDQISQLGNRIEQTCDRVDALIEGKQDNDPSRPAAPPSHLLDRLTVLESQMQQLMQRVQYLERREVSQLAIQVQPRGVAAEDEMDDDVEDEPDEILWDFFNPSEQQK